MNNVWRVREFLEMFDSWFYADGNPNRITDNLQWINQYCFELEGNGLDFNHEISEIANYE